MGKFTYLLMAAAGVIGFAAGLSPTAKLASALRTAGSAPIEAKVADAVVGRWVTLTDAKLRCDTRAVYKDALTFFLATDSGLANPFVAQFVGVVPCEAASASTMSGAFVPDPLTMADLAQYGLDAKGAAALKLFTPLATPKYLRMALLPFVAMLLIGAGITGWGVRGLLRAKGAPRS
jgi:hypothetical protein